MSVKLINFIVKQRLKAMLVAIIVILPFYIINGHHPVSIVPSSSNVGLIGAIVVFMGMLLRSWAAGIIHKNKKVTTEGPYSLFRHPLYIGSLFLTIGFTIILNYIWLWLIIVIFVIVVYIPKIRAEEESLEYHFGEEYLKYKSEVWYFFPLKLRLGKLFFPWSFKHWVRHKEYEAFLASLVGMILLEIWSRF